MQVGRGQKYSLQIEIASPMKGKLLLLFRCYPKVTEGDGRFWLPLQASTLKLSRKQYDVPSTEELLSGGNTLEFPDIREHKRYRV